MIVKTYRLVLVVLVSVGVVAAVAAGYLFGVTLAVVAGLWFLTAYTAATVTHWVAQVVFAELNKRRWDTDLGLHPTITIVVPAHRELEALYRRCLESIADQTYPHIDQVIVSDDAGEDHAAHEYNRAVFEQVAAGHPIEILSRELGDVFQPPSGPPEENWPKWVYIDEGRVNRGKRRAMYDGLRQATGDLVCFLDSDTVLAPDAIAMLIRPLEHPEVGCATGNIRVLNRGANALTFLTDLRYWLAFNLERGAQSYHGVMSCVGGPLGVYRRELVDQVKDRWVNQRFLGNECTFGDDRHMTNLILGLGYKSVYVPQATADTDAPERLGHWLRQQLRWSRSFFREYLINVGSFRKHSPFLAYDLTFQLLFPLFVLTNVAILVYLVVTGQGALVVLWSAAVLFFALLRAIYAVANTRNPEFILFLGYGFLYVLVLLPLKIVGYATAWRTTWGRKPSASNNQSS